MQTTRHELPGDHLEDGFTELNIGEHVLYLSTDQAALVCDAVNERNADFTQQITDLHSLRGTDNSALDLDNLRKGLRDKAFAAFAEPSLLGMIIGDAEEELLRAYQQAADEVVIEHGGDPLGLQFLGDVQTEINTQQDVMRHYGVESADTQYWHFTPRIRDLARVGLLKSGAHPDITHFTGPHSEGVHFVRPGPGNPRNGWVDDWMNYAHHTHSIRGSEPIPEALGAAIVLPLARLALATPFRNEHRVTDNVQQPIASDTTFRTAEKSPLYSYPLADAYVIPFIGSSQKKNDYMTPTTTVRFAFFNYGMQWADQHVIDVSTSAILAGNDVEDAFAQIAAHIERKFTGNVVVPLTSKPDKWEQLDGSPEPRVERLMIVKTNPAAKLPKSENNPRSRGHMDLIYGGLDKAPLKTVKSTYAPANTSVYWSK